MSNHTSIRKKLLITVVSLCIPMFFLAQTARPVGINLTAVVDYSTELVFTDAFKQSRFWTPHNADGSGPWDTGSNIPLDARGYPLLIPYDDGVLPPQKVRALMLWDIGEAVPVGKYRLIVHGTGEVSLHFGASGRFVCPVDTLVDVTGGLALTIESSKAEVPIQQIQFIYPQYIHNFQEKTFTDEFLEFLGDFQVIRFMDWLRTNNSTVTTWSDRSRLDYFTQTLTSGVSWEYIIELCNLLGKDMWINIPHRADDDYMVQLATMLSNQLDPNVKIYLEYSNEVWNGIFSQNYEAADLATGLGYTGEPWEKSWKFTAKRSADIFRIFKEVFGSDNRFIKLIPSQAGNSWVSGRIMSHFIDPLYNPTGEKADALTIAPYFGGAVAEEIVNEGLAHSITTEEIIERLETSLSESASFIDDNLEVARQYQLQMMGYEGGQHLVASWQHNNDVLLVEKLIAANNHPALKEVYCAYLDYWYEKTGDMFVHFSSHSLSSKWGSWGVKETMDDVNNPKYLALKECIFPYNTIATSSEPDPAKLLLFPNPSNGQFYLSGNVTAHQVTVTDLLGRKIPFEWQEIDDQTMAITLKTVGVFIVRVGMAVNKIVVLQ